MRNSSATLILTEHRWHRPVLELSSSKTQKHGRVGPTRKRSLVSRPRTRTLQVLPISNPRNQRHPNHRHGRALPTPLHHARAVPPQHLNACSTGTHPCAPASQTTFPSPTPCPTPSPSVTAISRHFPNCDHHNDQPRHNSSNTSEGGPSVATKSGPYAATEGVTIATEGGSYVTTEGVTTQTGPIHPTSPKVPTPCSI
jgi:hypothetical protein